MPPTINIHAPLSQVTVITSARLHMGFYDLSESLHQFGGMGLAIDAPTTKICIAKSENPFNTAICNEDIVKTVEILQKAFNLTKYFSLEVTQSIPQHVGFGSGTQLALAVGQGLNQLFGLNLSVQQIAGALGRGRRSGIGIGAFEKGGFLVDAGKNNTEITQIAQRLQFYSDWRVLLISDSAHIGVNGAVEMNAFTQLKPAKGHLYNMVFAHMLPALQHGDLLAFGAYIMDLQAYNGEYFAAMQGGVYASLDVASVLAWLQNNGAACVGQSSWGPTGFAILNSAEHAEALQKQAQLAFKTKTNISFQIVRGNNSGALINCK